MRSLGKALYFCVPRNDKLLSYWDTVADRLFKIRNSLNIQGIFRQLPLFEPPIDPAMLARAAAAGLDVGAIVNGLNQPLPLVRFQLLVQKAAEICQEVKSLGSNLLSAMEKEDGEAMAILRAKHERVVMEMVEHVRYAPAAGGDQVQGRLAQVAGPGRAALHLLRAATGQEGRRGREGDPRTGRARQGQPGQDEVRHDGAGGGDRGRSTWTSRRTSAPAGRWQIISSHEAEELEKSGLARDIQDAVRVCEFAAQGLRDAARFRREVPFLGHGRRHAKIGGTNRCGELASHAADVSMADGDRVSYRSRHELRRSAPTPAASRTGPSRATWPRARSPRSSSSCVRAESVKRSPSWN